MSHTPGSRHSSTVVQRQTDRAVVDGIQVRLLVHEGGQIYNNEGWHQYVSLAADASVTQFRDAIRHEYRKCARTDSSMALAGVSKGECFEDVRTPNPMRDDLETDYVQQYVRQWYVGNHVTSNMHISCDINGNLVNVLSGGLNRINGDGDLKLGSNARCIIEVFADDYLLRVDRAAAREMAEARRAVLKRRWSVANERAQVLRVLREDEEARRRRHGIFVANQQRLFESMTTRVDYVQNARMHSNPFRTQVTFVLNL